MLAPGRMWATLLLAAHHLLVGCGPAASGGATGAPAAMSPSGEQAAPGQRIRVVFRDGKAFAREGGREWPIAEVGRDEMVWAPDGLRFAYLKRAAASAPLSSADSKALPVGESWRIVIRNVRGDSVNEFAVYRPGRPADLDWADNDRLAYLAPPDASGDAYVLHAASTGEVLQVLRGRRFVWGPGRKQLAYVSGRKNAESVRVGPDTVWPRDPDRPRRRAILGEPVWSSDGTGLAFMERTARDAGNLVVLLVLDNREGDLIWALPKGALEPDNRLFWAESKVVIGKSQFQPRFAASWRRVR